MSLFDYLNDGISENSLDLRNKMREYRLRKIVVVSLFRDLDK